MAAQNYLRLRLPDGEFRHYLLPSNGQSTDELKNFEVSTGPFSGEWLKTAEGTLVRRSAIVEAATVSLEEQPGWPWPGEESTS